MARAVARDPTDVLTAPLVRAVFERLPADQHARCACVSRGWRAAVADPVLWTRLDLSGASGATCRVTDAALRAAAARALGRLEALDVTGCKDFHRRALSDVVAANAASLRELRTLEVEHQADEDHEFGLAHLGTLLAAAPALRVLEVNVFGTSSTVRHVLRNDPPFQAVRVRRLTFFWDEVDDVDDVFPAVAAEIRAHASLKHLTLYCGEVWLGPREVDLALEAARALRGLETLKLGSCWLTPAAAPALARLLSSTTLKELSVFNEGLRGPRLLDAAAAALLADALRTNRTLRLLGLNNVELWDDVEAAIVVVGALLGHASLRVLDFGLNEVETDAARFAACVALGALLAVTPLETLDLSGCNLGAAGLCVLAAALPLNTHLRVLNLSHNNLSADFVELQLLPALRANASLREISLSDIVTTPHAADWAKKQQLVREAVQVVKEREAVRVAAEAATAAAQE